MKLAGLNNNWQTNFVNLIGLVAYMLREADTPSQGWVTSQVFAFAREKDTKKEAAKDIK